MFGLRQPVSSTTEGQQPEGPVSNPEEGEASMNQGSQQAANVIILVIKINRQLFIAICCFISYYNTQFQFRLQQQPSNFNYTPSDFRLLSVLTVAVCGVLSPLTLTLSIPALLYSKKVQLYYIDLVILKLFCIHS